MENDITPVSIANSIMQDETYKGYCLIVEGNKDYKLYNKFINKKNVKIINAHGKENVKEVMDILKSRDFNRIIAIIDSDFDRILNTKCNQDNIFYTDYHDSEVMMLKANILDNIFSTYGLSEEKIKEFVEKNNATTVLDIIVNIAEEIGILKIASIKNELGLLFKPKRQDDKKLKYEKFIDTRTLKFLGKDKLIDTVREYSRTRTKNSKGKEEINDAYDETCIWWKSVKEEYEIYDFINGHDLSNIVFIFINKVIRLKNGSITDSDDLENKFILAYDVVDFIETSLFNNMLKWSVVNKVRIFNKKIEDNTPLKELFTFDNISDVKEG